MKIVDAHMHFWSLARGDYDWLTPDVSALYRDFEPADIEAELAQRGVSMVIAVQATGTEAETRFLLDLAARHPRIAGVVGWTDFESPHCAQRMDALIEIGRARLKGFRPMVQDIADPDWLLRPSLDGAFQALIERDLSFDALVKPVHLPVLRQRLSLHPELRAVVDHAGKPDVHGEGRAAWAEDIAALAEQPRLFCKLSGLLTEGDRAASLDELDPFVAHVLHCFGPERVMWGSDWPVLTLRADYGHWHRMARELIRRHAPGHEAQVFGDNSRAFYRLPRPAGD
ncbi:amidohydrolase family protein [Lysobacter sp. CA199]|uniref:amidohydrolase family protein n=1 Tax=Lysobacter sp. CA199 TaxID=3455608 RepID=UPI003F8CF344